jgi:hypothetical protein
LHLLCNIVIDGCIGMNGSVLVVAHFVK